MKFTDLFGKAISRWIKYSEYDTVQAENGDWYIMPSKEYAKLFFPLTIR